ncbi:MAG: ABC transporter substrate-binding protein [Bradyrhizobium sp.]|nr:MAG: ABC transporter substrate-binding protein [Bradyrhizobium sp.]
MAGFWLTRRGALQGSAALAAATLLPRSGLADDATIESHGLSSFGDLALPPDFKHFAYVNPEAPKAGQLTLQITATGGNQNFDTFDTLNIFSAKGDGAAGMSACFDTLMTGNGDEPDSLYGLVARAVRYSADRLEYRFLIRPEARFSDGSKLTAADAGFSLNLLKIKGHPIYMRLLDEVESAQAESDEVLLVRFAPTRSRDAHLIVAGMPIFSQIYWSTRDFTASTLEAPLGSGAYRLGRFETGRFIEFERDPNYWAKDLPVNVGQNNFAKIRFEYYRERQVAFEAFKAGELNFHEELTVAYWVSGYDFPAAKEGRVKTETLHSGAPVGSQAYYMNMRREQFADPRVREAVGLAFDFEWTNKNVKYSTTKRVVSYFQNTDMEAKGAPGPEELAILAPFRGKVPDEVFGDVYTPPVSDGSGSDRQLLRKANELLLAAGCKREGGALKLPSGKPFVIEFLDFSDFLQPVTFPYLQNLQKLGIDARLRVVDSAQFKARTENFDFDVTVARFSGALTPGLELSLFYGSKAAGQTGSRNLAGVADPAVDALLGAIANAKSRDELNFTCRALDRVLRAGRYWTPMYYRDDIWIAYWNAFSRPEHQPRLGTGAPDTWWWDEEKAKKIGL